MSIERPLLHAHGEEKRWCVGVVINVRNGFGMGEREGGNRGMMGHGGRNEKGQSWLCCVVCNLILDRHSDFPSVEDT